MKVVLFPFIKISFLFFHLYPFKKIMDSRVFPALIFCLIAVLFLLFAFYHNFIPTDIIYIDNNINLNDKKDDGKITNIYYDRIDIENNSKILEPYKKGAYNGKCNNKESDNLNSEYKFLCVNENIILGNHLNNSYIRLIDDKIFTVKILPDNQFNNSFTLWNDSEKTKNIKYYEYISDKNRYIDKFITIKSNEVISFKFNDHKVIEIIRDNINNNYHILNEYLSFLLKIYFDELLIKFHQDMIIIIESMLLQNQDEKECYKELINSDVSLLGNEIILKLSNTNIINSIDMNNDEIKKIYDELNILEEKFRNIFNVIIFNDDSELKQKIEAINTNSKRNAIEKFISLLDYYKKYSNNIDNKVLDIFFVNVNFKDKEENSYKSEISEIVKIEKKIYHENLENICEEFNEFLDKISETITIDILKTSEPFWEYINNSYILTCKNVISYITMITNNLGKKIKNLKHKLTNDQKTISFNILSSLLRMLKNGNEIIKLIDNKTN